MRKTKTKAARMLWLMKLHKYGKKLVPNWRAWKKAFAYKGERVEDMSKRAVQWVPSEKRK